MANEIQYKNFWIDKESVEIKKSDGERTFTCIITTDDVDLANEVVDPDGLQINEFKKNPIILLEHNTSIDHIAGKGVSLRRKGNGFQLKVLLAKNIQKIDDVWELVKQGILKAVSIGFINLDDRPATKPDIEKYGKLVRRVICRSKLKEVSLVALGMNESALITSCKELEIDPSYILGNDYVETEEITIDKEVIDKTIDELEIDINKEQKQEIVKIVKENKISMTEVMKYFKEEIQEKIKYDRGELF